ncbi:hypothetical protein MWU76_13735 [Gelidibacter sp. F2691]|nr:hypothetical protein [Gelidibacter sp. F2691]
MKTHFIMILLVFSACLQAQTNISYNPSSGTSGVATMNATLSGESGIAGSIYLFKEWVLPAKVFTVDNKVINVPNINYNAKNSFFASKMTKDSIFIFHGINKVEAQGKRFDKIGDKFYEVLYTFDDHKMFLKEHIAVEKPELHHITSTVIGPGKYVFEDKYYLFTNNELLSFWPSKKNILDAVDSEKSAVNQQVKTQKWSFSKEEDIIKIFKYYDTL